MGSQEDAIRDAGLILGSKADDPANVSVTIEQMNRMFDVVPHAYVRITIAETDTLQGIEYTNKRLVIRSVSFDYVNEIGFHNVQLECEAEGLMLEGQPVTFPDVTEPPLIPPPTPPEPPEPPGIPEPYPYPEPSAGDAVVTTLTDVRTSDDLDNATPTWDTELDGSPSAPIDSDLPLGERDIFYVLEDASVWKTENLTEAGVATWTEVYTLTQFASASGASNAHFLRLRAPTASLIYVLAYGGDSEDNLKAWIVRSSDGGTSWAVYQVEADMGTMSGMWTLLETICWTVETSTITIQSVGEGLSFTFQAGGDIQFPSIQTAAVLQLSEELPLGEFTLEYDVIGDMPSVDYDEDGDMYPYAQSAGGTSYNNQIFDDIVVTPISGGVHVSGTFHTDLGGGSTYLDRTKMAIGYFFGYVGHWSQFGAPDRTFVVQNLTADGVAFEGSIYMCMDVARTNNNWLYIGLEDRIVASEDGGASWFLFYSVHGALDVCVDPQLAGALYYWSTDGNLNLLIKGATGSLGVLNAEGLITEPSPIRLFGRIARDPSTGRLYGLVDGTALHVRNLGSNTVLKTAMTRAHGIHVYAGGNKMIFCTWTDIFISDDLRAASPTITSKLGIWAAPGYLDGVNAHRME
jgi:hypothetical protein